MEKNRIPKIIHYCWFGKKKLPPLARKCIESWKKYCPDYEIKEWNESNFDLNACPYVKEAYEAKKWAFISDYVRLYALVNEGGVYMDTDVEVIAPLERFLKNRAFSGFEEDVCIPTGIMASEPGFPLFSDLLRDYDRRHFKRRDGSFDLTTNVATITRLCKKYGFVGNNKFQCIRGLVLYPKDVFCPKSHSTGKIHLTRRTATIHHFAGSWICREAKIASFILDKTKTKGKILNLLGRMVAGPFTYISRIKNENFQKVTLYYIRKFIKLITWRRN